MAEKKEKKEAAPKVERVASNGVTKPAAGTKTGAVWDICDAISTEKERPAFRKEVMEAPAAKGMSKGTLATQYGKWCTFHGVTKEMIKEFKEKEAPQPEAEPEPAE